MNDDGCHTDGQFGVDHEMKTMLALFVDHYSKDVENYCKTGRRDMLPNYYVDRLGGLIGSIEAQNW